MTNWPSTKSLIALVGAGLALAVALGAAATLPTAATMVLPVVLLAVAGIAAAMLFFLAVAAQGRRERSTLQKAMNKRAQELGSAVEAVASVSADLQDRQRTMEAGVAEIGAAQSRMLDTLKSGEAATRVNLGAIAEELGGLRREQREIPAAVSTLRRDQSAVSSSIGDVQGAIDEALERLRAQDVDAAKLLGTVRAVHRLVDDEDSRTRKLLNLLRAETREREKAGAATADGLDSVRLAVDGLHRDVAAVGKSSSDAALTARRMHNFLRKDGSIQIVLDRYIASERRAFGALETARLELVDELRRTSAEWEGFRGEITARMEEAGEASAERERARAEALDGRLGEIGEGLAGRLGEVGEALGGRIGELEAAGSDRSRGVHERLEQLDDAAAERERTRRDELTRALEELREHLEGRLGALEDGGAQHTHDVMEKLGDIAQDGGRSADRAVALLSGLDATQGALNRLEGAQDEARRGSESILETLQDLRSDAEARASRGSSEAGSADRAPEILDALDRTAADLKELVTSTGQTGEAETRRVGMQMSERVHRLLKRETIENVRQTEALLQLLERVDTSGRRFPATGWWALAADSLLFLSDHILETRPRRILEVGSGASTVWLGTFAQRVGADYVSLEHDAEFAAHTREMISQHGLEDTVDLRHAMLTATTIDGHEYQWYDESAFEDIGGDFDLLIVDGPPEATGDMARFPAMPILADRLSAGAAVVLDDVHREAETESLKQWSERFEGFQIVQTGLSRTGMMMRTPSH